MSNSTSQPQPDVTSLTTQVKDFGLESSPHHQPRGPRWLSLSPYRRAIGFFNNWQGITEGTFLEGNTEGEDVVSDSQISHLDLDDHEKEEGVDLFDNAERRALWALRCYYYNLEMVTLASEERVDEGILSTIQKLLELSVRVPGSFPISQSVDEAERIDGGEPSNEERVVAEMEWYIRQAQNHGAAPSRDIIDMAMKVQKWDEKRGTVDLDS